jgi:hypothetical protein
MKSWFRRIFSRNSPVVVDPEVLAEQYARHDEILERMRESLVHASAVTEQLDSGMWTVDLLRRRYRPRPRKKFHERHWSSDATSS